MAQRLQVVNCHLRRNASHQYKYTTGGGNFTTDQRKQYEEKGYIMVANLIPKGLLDECRERFVDICEGRIAKGGMTLMKDISFAKTQKSDRQEIYNKVQDIVWDEVFSKYILYPQLLDIVENFTGANIMAMHSMLINKPPDSGKLTSEHPLHQDLHYFGFRPADKIVAAWTAIDRTTEHNGCLVVLPGTHRLALLHHDYPQYKGVANKGYHGVKGFDDYPSVSLYMEPGDTVFFHPLLIHGSGPNLTQGFRKAISCHYAASDCHYIDIEGTSQQNIADEVKTIAARRGLDMDFEEFWKFRNRLARGKIINL